MIIINSDLIYYFVIQTLGEKTNQCRFEAHDLARRVNHCVSLLVLWNGST